MEELRDNAEPDIAIMLVGNKVDLCDRNASIRRVPTQQGEQFAQTHGLKLNMFELDEKEFEQAKKEFMETHGLNEKEYEQNKKEFDETIRFNYKELELEND